MAASPPGLLLAISSGQAGLQGPPGSVPAQGLCTRPSRPLSSCPRPGLTLQGQPTPSCRVLGGRALRGNCPEARGQLQAPGSSQTASRSPWPVLRVDRTQAGWVDTSRGGERGRGGAAGAVAALCSARVVPEGTAVQRQRRGLRVWDWPYPRETLGCPCPSPKSPGEGALSASRSQGRGKVEVGIAQPGQQHPPGCSVTAPSSGSGAGQGVGSPSGGPRAPTRRWEVADARGRPPAAGAASCPLGCHPRGSRARGQPLAPGWSCPFTAPGAGGPRKRRTRNCGTALWIGPLGHSTKGREGTCPRPLHAQPPVWEALASSAAVRDSQHRAWACLAQPGPVPPP